MWTADNRPRYNRDKLRYPSDLSATALHFSRHLRTNALRRVSTSEAVSA